MQYPAREHNRAAGTVGRVVVGAVDAEDSRSPVAPGARVELRGFRIVLSPNSSVAPAALK